ncbi:MAG TPA: hypothetical protein VLI04_03685 [Nocardioidaceae bacterium]|nr:hypothetical protein [Nocardioidaceae bacterium]
MGRMVALVAAAALTAGCSSAPPSRPIADPTSSPTSREATPEAAPSATPPRTSFPAPSALGPGWSYGAAARDHGHSEPDAGADGVQRDPGEVVALAVPLGCPRPAAMPTAESAHEVDYSFRGRAAIAIRLRFGRPAQAAEFVRARETNLRGCIGLSGGPAVGPYVAAVRGDLNDRTPESEPWAELVLHRQAWVLLLAAEGTIEEQPFDVPRIRRLLGAA